MLVRDGTLFVVGTDGFWRSDGTPEGTIRLRGGVGKEIAPFRGGVIGSDLWMSDGTAEGTRRIVPADSEPLLYPDRTVRAVTDDLAVFTTCHIHRNPCQLWRTDGTEQGTFPIATIDERYLDDSPAGTHYYPVVIPSTAGDGRFVVFADGAWSSDGTAEGTQRLALEGGADGRSPLKQKVGGVWIFAGWDRLWRSDGTPEGTRSLAYFSGGRVDLLGGSNEVAVVAVELEGGGTELWRSDGTEAGTFAVSPMPALGRWAWDEEDHPGRATVGNTVFFSGCPPDLPCQLWAVTISSPSTTTTTTSTSTTTTTTILPLRSPFLIKDINPIRGPAGCNGLNGSDPGGGARIGDAVLFRACGRLNDPEIWRTDGTPEGTVQVSDLDTGNEDGPHGGSMTAVGRRIFFVAEDPSAGEELWVTDGTREGTVRVTDFIDDPDFDSLIEMDGHLFFSAWTSDEIGRQLWRTDGTVAGTIPLTDFPYQPSLDQFTTWALTKLNGGFFFAVCGERTGCELWRSDGTAAGTERMAMLIPPGEVDDGSTVGGLTPAGDTLFFSVCPDVYDDDTPCELWTSDGTPAGTVPAPGVDLAALTPATGDVRYLRRRDSARSNYQLWRSDGTEDGTFPLTDLPAGRSFGSVIAELDGTLLVKITDGQYGALGAELFGLPLCGGEPGPCDPVTGECAIPPWPCDDGDPCTLDGCNPGVGCSHELAAGCPVLFTPTTSTTTTSSSTTTTTSTTVLDPAASTTSTTTSEVPVSTTSTTLTCSIDTVALCDDADPCTVDLCDAGRCHHEIRPGLAGARCRLRHLAPSLACEPAMPSGLERRLDRARRFVKRAADAGDQRKARRRIRRADRQLDAAAKMVARSAQQGIGSACADALERAIAEARAGMNGWLARDRGR
jgi:ELWxxDGT repeat protein